MSIRRPDAAGRLRRATSTGFVVLAACTLPASALAVGAPSPSAVDGSSMVTVEVVAATPADLTDAARITMTAGGSVLGGAPGVLLVLIPAASRGQLTAGVAGEVRTPVPVDVRPERTTPGRLVEQYGTTTGVETAVTNADAWHADGFDGSGVKIGVVDFFDVPEYWNVDEHGPLPQAGVNALCLDEGMDCTSEFFDGIDRGGEDHGVAVVEIIRDMAPGAEIYIGQAATLSDYIALINWFAANGVQVVNRSLGSRYDGPGDGRGPLDDVVAHAVARGILWVNSGGNNGRERYYRQQVRLAGDRVAFGPTGSNTFLQFTGCVALGGVRWADDWDKPPAERTDYDVYLWESPRGAPSLGRIVDSSTHNQRTGAAPIETGIDSHCAPNLDSALYLEVRWKGGGDIAGDVLEILDYGDGIESYTQRAGSAAVSVVDSTLPGVLGVAAIDPPSGGKLASYSSEGPTNDGRIAPDVAAPSGFSNSVFGTFSGTSASAPVIAGGAALLLGAGLATGPNALGDLIRNTTVDRGVAGPDSRFGYGEFRLPDPPDAAGIDATPSRFVALAAPVRFLDTRPTTAKGPAGLIGELWRGEMLRLPVRGVKGIPASGVSAVAVNLVSVGPDRPSYVQAVPTLQGALGAYANLNADAIGQTRSNFAIVPVGADGSISIYSTAVGHVVVDVLGWFEPTAEAVSGGRFVEFGTARRLLDTRTDGPATPIAAGSVRSIPMPSGVDPNLIEALVVTVAAVAPTQPGWIQVFPADRPDVIGRTATVNVAGGDVVANTAIVPVGSTGAAIAARFADGGSSHVVVEALGYITTDAAPSALTGRYVPVSPNRAFDSRLTIGPLRDRKVVVVDASTAPGVTVPDTADGVMWNVVIVDARRAGYLRGWPADGVEPATSSLNWRSPGETRASAAITAVDRGRARFRIEDGAANLPGPVGDLVVDVFGYFT